MSYTCDGRVVRKERRRGLARLLVAEFRGKRLARHRRTTVLCPCTSYNSVLRSASRLGWLEVKGSMARGIPSPSFAS